MELINATLYGLSLGPWRSCAVDGSGRSATRLVGLRSTISERVITICFLRHRLPFKGDENFLLGVDRLLNSNVASP